MDPTPITHLRGNAKVIIKPDDVHFPHIMKGQIKFTGGLYNTTSIKVRSKMGYFLGILASAKATTECEVTQIEVL